MARLRKPSPNEPTLFMPPNTTRATRSSPRKASRPRYTSSSDEENSVLVPKASRQELRHTDASSQETEDSFSTRKSVAASDALSPRKQRILRPVESNSRLLRKLSDESLASPEKKQRERRVRSGTTDTDVGKKTNLLYARTLAKSVVKKQASRAKIDVVGEEELQKPLRQIRKEDVAEEDALEVEIIEDAETSLWCGEDQEPSQDNEDVLPVVEDSDEEDDDPVVVRQRQTRLPTRRIEVDTADEDEDEDEEDDKFADALPEVQPQRILASRPKPRQEQKAPAVDELLPLTSMRPPHRKGHSTISNWAQEVIDLTDSPEPPLSFAPPPLPPPTRVRSASFASSRPQTSSSNSGLAILTYSPTHTKHRSPIKAPPLSRPVTPPRAPSSPSKLVSPSKKKPAIPKAPNLRPSLDAFWDPAVVNEHNEKHSPVKTLVSPKKQKWRDDIVKMMEGIALADESSNTDEEFPSPTTSPRKKKTNIIAPSLSPTKKPVFDSSTPDVKAIRAQRKAFADQKHALAESFLLELDSTIAQNRISSLASQTGGIKLVWSRTLKTTAGRANWRREQVRIRTGPLASDFKTEVRHHCSIELAEKVIDDEDRLYNVLAHEFCHLTTFMISNVRNNPHGAEFKAWGRKASQAFASRGVEVTTKHSYAIEYKYVWECVACGHEFKRHSKSVDTARHSCGRCKGKLVQTKPVPRGGGAATAGGAKKEKSEYQIFVKSNFGRVKRELEERGEKGELGKVMEVLGREYRELKGKGKSVDGSLEEALEGLKI